MERSIRKYLISSLEFGVDSLPRFLPSFLLRNDEYSIAASLRGKECVSQAEAIYPKISILNPKYVDQKSEETEGDCFATTRNDVSIVITSLRGEGNVSQAEAIFPKIYILNPKHVDQKAEVVEGDCFVTTRNDVSIVITSLRGKRGVSSAEAICPNIYIHTLKHLHEIASLPLAMTDILSLSHCEAKEVFHRPK